jgi:hypothetical protein
MFMAGCIRSPVAITEVLYFGRISPKAEQLLELTRKSAIKVDIKIGPTGKPYVLREQMRFSLDKISSKVRASR